MLVFSCIAVRAPRSARIKLSDLCDSSENEPKLMGRRGGVARKTCGRPRNTGCALRFGCFLSKLQSPSNLGADTFIHLVAIAVPQRLILASKGQERQREGKSAAGHGDAVSHAGKTPRALTERRGLSRVTSCVLSGKAVAPVLLSAACATC
ncbi:hypothetical protein MRX96_055711 [Rhipicephalus microplus]